MDYCLPRPYEKVGRREEVACLVSLFLMLGRVLCYRCSVVVVVAAVPMTDVRMVTSQKLMPSALLRPLPRSSSPRSSSSLLFLAPPPPRYSCHPSSSSSSFALRPPHYSSFLALPRAWRLLEPRSSSSRRLVAPPLLLRLAPPPRASLLLSSAAVVHEEENHHRIIIDTKSKEKRFHKRGRSFGGFLTYPVPSSLSLSL